MTDAAVSPPAAAAPAPASAPAPALDAACVGLLGVGQLGEALVRLLCAPAAPGRPRPRRVVAWDPARDRLHALAATHRFDALAGAAEVAAAADVVLLVVKPAHVAAALAAAAPAVRCEQLWISVAAGVRIETLQAGLGPGVPLVRAMPNVALAVGAGATGLCAAASARAGDLALAESLFGLGGATAALADEALLDVVTALSGSGPAYLFVAMEALADGAVRMGLPRPLADRLARHTVFGAGALAARDSRHVAELKDSVASPGGTTIAALAALEARGFRGALIEAVREATERARVLGAPPK